MIRRLDHIIIAVRDRHEWASRIEQVLGLVRGRNRDADEWGFANWEFDIGDGFLGVVCPDGSDSALDRFLARTGDAYYAVSVDVGPINDALRSFEERDVPVHVARRDGVPVLLWPQPRRATAGVLFQVYGGSAPHAGGNSHLLGLRRVVLAADELAARSAELQRSFALAEPSPPELDDELAATTTTFDLGGSPLGQQLVLAAPIVDDSPLARHLARLGPSIYEWGLSTEDLDAELERLSGHSIAAATSESAGERRALIDPGSLGGLRIRLHEHT